MPENERFPLQVDLILAQALVSGSIDLQEERRRLVDVLNTTSSMFSLSAAQLQMDGAEPQELAALSIAKSAILVAIPRETVEQGRHRALQRAMVSMDTMRGSAVLYVPPLTITGVAHGPGGQGKLPSDPAVLSHFFSVTGASVVLPNGQTINEPFVLVNRDAIAALTIVPEPTPVRRDVQATPQQDDLSALLQRLASNS